MRGFEGLYVGDRVRIERVGTDAEEDSSTLPEQKEGREVEIHPSR
jgi:hypothetical protein